MANSTEGIVEEIRFGAVLYGGVSLCIYINGVTQELLRMVEATGPNAKDFSGTREIYRKLAMLSSRESAEGAASRWKKLSPNGTENIQRKFVVDALSGTSAGGINAVFLAKALVKRQSLDRTKIFWIEEGGIEKLINDSASFEGLKLKPKGLPASLLNSQRMYDRLLEALNQMEDPASEGSSPLVEEIDLFITTTDLAGRKVSIPLADQVVSEKDYHQAFHFSFKRSSPCTPGEGEFDQKRNPYLAFAARCTSAFPVAFEPMRGVDAQEQLAAQGKKGLTNPGWDRFLKENVLYGKDEGEPIEKKSGSRFKADETDTTGFRNRSFGDGGILDNKPFSYILDALSNRTAGPLVERKLIYIDPSPENPDDGAADGKPDALAYALKALTGLPGYETIRSDVRNIINRNRLIDKVDTITSGIVKDLKIISEMPTKPGAPAQAEAVSTTPNATELHWEMKGLDDMLPSHGMAYGGYHRLKISALTEDWTMIIARTLNWQNHPWRLHVLREIFRSWRNGNYQLMRSPSGKPTENQFLFDYDLPYRKRRLAFVLEKADALLRMDPNALAVLDETNLKSLQEVPNDGQREDFRKSLRDIKSDLKDALVYLKLEESKLFRESSEDKVSAELLEFQSEFLKVYLSGNKEGVGAELTPQSMATGLSLESLKTMPEERRMKELENIFSPSGTGRNLVEKLNGLMINGFNKKPVDLFTNAHGKCEKAFNQDSAKTVAGAWALKALNSFYKDFDYYDMVLFPLTYCTEVGENSRVAIHRISPQSLYSSGASKGESRPELAGAAFGHFGAFLDKRWRRNDILWGRLDAVEKLIDILVPEAWEADVRSTILAEARNAVLDEEITASTSQALGEAVVEVFMASTPALLNQITKEGETIKVEGTKRSVLSPEQIGALVAPLAKEITGDINQTLLQKLVTRKGWHDAILVHRPEKLDRVEFLRILSRSAVVMGKVLDGVARGRSMTNSLTGGLIYLGRLFWGLVELTFPSGWTGGFLRKVVAFGLLFCLCMVVAGSFFNAAGFASLGWKCFVVILVADLARFSLWSYAQRKGWGFFKVLLGSLLVMLLLLPGYFLAHYMNRIIGFVIHRH